MAPLSYSDWTQLLCKHFFRPDRAQQPVTFFVDDELLGHLEGSGDPDAGVDSLVTALLPRLSPDSYGGLFASIEQECAIWRARTPAACPPSLPLLASAVLAATRMARESGIAANNYWTRFSDL